MVPIGLGGNQGSVKTSLILEILLQFALCFSPKFCLSSIHFPFSSHSLYLPPSNPDPSKSVTDEFPVDTGGN